MRWNLCAGRRIGVEHVVIEHRAPVRALGFGQVAHRQDRQHQCVHRRIHPGRHRAPPAVDQHIERVQSFHVVPPERRNEDGIARRQFCHLRLRQRLAEAWEALEIRCVEVNQADRLAGRGQIQRADIKIAYLVGGEQGDPATPRSHAGKVVRYILVGGDARAIADPDAGQRVGHAQLQRIRFGQAGQEAVQRGRGDVDRRRRRVACVLQQRGQHDLQRHLFAAEVEAAHVLVVEQPPLCFGRCGGGGHRHPAGIEADQMGDCSGIGGACGGHQRPMRDQPADHLRRGPSRQLLVQLCRVQAMYFIDGAERLQHARMSGGVCGAGPAPGSTIPWPVRTCSARRAGTGGRFRCTAAAGGRSPASTPTRPTLRWSADRSINDRGTGHAVVAVQVEAGFLAGYLGENNVAFQDDLDSPSRSFFITGWPAELMYWIFDSTQV
ncbi:hypothetical protein G6F68_010053 [Rhizopus microsporus]|nr:hypothetical protein G6F68_010053 [Rhizopus microsporus]